MNQSSDLPTVTSGEALLSYIRRHVDPAGRLAPADRDLPDEPQRGDDELRWAPGALDGVLGHHGAGGAHERRAKDVAALLVDACAQPTDKRLHAVHEALLEGDALGIVDLLMGELTRLQPSVDSVRRIGLWLASTSPMRAPVKIGLALLGATGCERHVDVVRTLGAHDEFTLYAAAALHNGLDEPDSELWALAASVDGWGRIHCVEHLHNTADPQIQSWLLRAGYRNSVMNQYTALIAAETGGLLAALEREPVDRALLTGAGDILSALIEEGPAGRIDSYGDGADTIERYLSVMRTRAEMPTDYLAVATIRDFVSDDDRFEFDEPGWTVSRRYAFQAACLEILGHSDWRDRVAALLTPDADVIDFHVARAVARDLGIDTFEVTVRRIAQDPLTNDWYDAWLSADRDRASRLAELARTRLPLAEIATGPGDSYGMGAGFAPHRALEWSLQSLKGHPGIGGDLLTTGLQSPTISNRNMALRAFSRWPAHSWPTEARELIEEAASTDPAESLREMAGRVLRGEPLD